VFFSGDVNLVLIVMICLAGEKFVLCLCLPPSEVKLWFAPSEVHYFIFSRWGVSIVFDLRCFAPLKMMASRFKAIVCSLPTLQNGPAGCGCNRACVRSAAARVAKSWDDGNGKVIFSGGESTVFKILFPLVLVM
jgi:hypothetical protein